MSGRSRRRLRGRRRGVGEVLVASLVIIAGVCLIVFGVRDIAADFETERHYERLGREARDREAKEAEPSIGRFELVPQAAAWLSVGGTPIDYPVAQANEHEPDYYLFHDLWGEETRVGCPHLDWRCATDDAHRIIYAHRIGTTQLQFSPISDTWKQDRFSQLTTASLVTRKGEETYIPLCALVVDKQFAGIQRFSMSQMELHSMLRSLVDEASATNPDALTLVGRARKALTLVTCASQQGGQRERTLLVFVSLNA